MYVIRSKEITLEDPLITAADRAALAEWIAGGASLARGAQTLAFEEEIARWLGVRHATMVNSGASANLVMVYALKEAGRLRNTRVVAPALSRPTTVTPLVQLGFQVSLCDCDPQSLNIDLHGLEQVFAQQRPALLVLPHVLGVPNDMARIQELCELYDVILLEDAREALGSATLGRKLGSFGTAASFSLRDGYQLSTVEGGLIVTDDTDLHQVIVSLRAHGARRNTGNHRRDLLCQRLGHGDYTIGSDALHAGFGLNGAEVNAFLGRLQITRLDAALARRISHREMMQRALPELFHQHGPSGQSVCNAYGTLVRNRDEVQDFMRHNRVACRPLIAPNIARLPFWYSQFGACNMPQADRVHDWGLALPIHSALTEVEILRIAELIRKIADPA